MSEIERLLDGAGFGEHRPGVVDRLRAQGILDDGRVARAFAEHALAKRGWARERVRSLLAERGAASETIDAALGEGPGDDARALELARRGLAAGDPPARVARRLVSR